MPECDKNIGLAAIAAALYYDKWAVHVAGSTRPRTGAPGKPAIGQFC